MNDLNDAGKPQMTDEEYLLYGKFRDKYIDLHRRIDDMEAKINALRGHVNNFRFGHAVEVNAALELAAMKFNDALSIPYKTEKSFAEYGKRGGE